MSFTENANTGYLLPTVETGRDFHFCADAARGGAPSGKEVACAGVGILGPEQGRRDRSRRPRR